MLWLAAWKPFLVLGRQDSHFHWSAWNDNLTDVAVSVLRWAVFSLTRPGSFPAIDFPGALKFGRCEPKVAFRALGVDWATDPPFGCF